MIIDSSQGDSIFQHATWTATSMLQAFVEIYISCAFRYDDRFIREQTTVLIYLYNLMFYVYGHIVYIYVIHVNKISTCILIFCSVSFLQETNI